MTAVSVYFAYFLESYIQSINKTMIYLLQLFQPFLQQQLILQSQFVMYFRLCNAFLIYVSEEEISNMRLELEKYGIQMPAFSKIGGILANELSVDEAARRFHFM